MKTNISFTFNFVFLACEIHLRTFFLHLETLCHLCFYSDWLTVISYLLVAVEKRKAA